MGSLHARPHYIVPPNGVARIVRLTACGCEDDHTFLRRTRVPWGRIFMRRRLAWVPLTIFSLPSPTKIGLWLLQTDPRATASFPYTDSVWLDTAAPAVWGGVAGPLCDACLVRTRPLPASTARHAISPVSPHVDQPRRRLRPGRREHLRSERIPRRGPRRGVDPAGSDRVFGKQRRCPGPIV